MALCASPPVCGSVDLWDLPFIGFVFLKRKLLQFHQHKSYIDKDHKYYLYRKVTQIVSKEFFQTAPKLPPVKHTCHTCQTHKQGQEKISSVDRSGPSGLFSPPSGVFGHSISSPREIPWSSPASPWNKLFFAPLLHRLI